MSDFNHREWFKKQYLEEGHTEDKTERDQFINAISWVEILNALQHFSDNASSGKRVLEYNVEIENPIAW